eukprot:410586_1
MKRSKKSRRKLTSAKHGALLSTSWGDLNEGSYTKPKKGVSRINYDSVALSRMLREQQGVPRRGAGGGYSVPNSSTFLTDLQQDRARQQRRLTDDIPDQERAFITEVEGMDPLPEVSLVGVEKALFEVRKNAQVRCNEIHDLREQNKRLKAQIVERSTRLKSVFSEMSLKDDSMKQLKAVNSKLIMEVDQGQDTLKTLTGCIKDAEREIRSLSSKNATMSKNIFRYENDRNVLHSTLESQREENRQIRLESSQYSPLLERLNTTLRSQEETFKTEQEAWKDKTLKLIQRLQRQESSTRTTAKEADQLAMDVMRLSQENMELDKKLKSQEGNMRTVVSEYDSHQDELRALSNEITKLNGEIASRDENHTGLKKSLAHAKNQLRQMAEKVVELVKQLNEAENAKAETILEMKNMRRKLDACSKRELSLRMRVHGESRTQRNFERQSANIKKESETYRRDLIETRKKLLRVDRLNTSLKQQLQAKDKQIKKMSRGPIRSASQPQLRSSTVNREKTRKLEKELKSVMRDSSASKEKLLLMEELNAKCMRSLSKKNIQLMHYKNSKRSDDSFSKSQLKSLLTGSSGKHVQQMLRELKVSSRTFRSWTSSPVRVVHQLARRYNDRNILLDGDSSSNEQTRPSRPDEQSSRAVSRLVRILGGDKSSGDEAPRTSRTTLSLAHSDLTNTEAVVLSEAVRSNHKIRVVDLRENRLGDTALVSLVMSCVSVKCGVVSLLVQGNNITLAGVKTLLRYLRRAGGKDMEVTFKTHNRVPVPVLTVKTASKTLTISLQNNRFSRESLQKVDWTSRRRSQSENDLRSRRNSRRKPDNISEILANSVPEMDGRATASDEDLVRSESPDDVLMDLPNDHFRYASLKRKPK